MDLIESMKYGYRNNSVDTMLINGIKIEKMLECETLDLDLPMLEPTLDIHNKPQLLYIVMYRYRLWESIRS